MELVSILGGKYLFSYTQEETWFEVSGCSCLIPNIQKSLNNKKLVLATFFFEITLNFH